MRLIITIFVTILINFIYSYSQFSIDAYKEYLKTHQDMTVDELLKEYPAGLFLDKAPTNLYDAKYGDSIDIKLKLTDHEKSLINDHGFMVSERLKYNNFLNAYKEIYYADLPVYVSADAILNALHFSYDNILEYYERRFLYSFIRKMVDSINNEIKPLSAKSSNKMYSTAINDLDVFICVGRNLIRGSEKNLIENPVFLENSDKVKEILNFISIEQKKDVLIFSNTVRPYDFSQFIPRGHYANNIYHNPLQDYFKTLMWLGRTEIYISSPKHQDPIYFQKTEDLKRQNILAALLSEAVNNSGAIKNLDSLDKILTLMVGKQDNITIFETSQTLEILGNKDALWVSEGENWKTFQTELMKLKSASQLCNSQILYSDPFLPEQADTPASLLLIGQRAIIDAFILGNVVYDKIIYQGKKVPRMIPSTMDLLFAIGNDAAIQLLEPQLRTEPYSTNLAALRYLISGYDNSYWNCSVYSNWLNAIRALSPPQDRSKLPLFMQTAAWQQKTMNTQLASWSQLRHDFLIYSKQSYSSGAPECSYPHFFVEPVPKVYESIKILMSNINNFINIDDRNIKKVINTFQVVCTNLESIAWKELNNEPPDSNEIDFINSIFNNRQSCAGGFWKGWYFDLHYELPDYDPSGYSYYPKDFTVTDVHTIPTDIYGNEKGWVLHAGTGNINLAVIVNEKSDGEKYAYAGPVYTYFETLTENYKRLTDAEWSKYFFTENSQKPALTNLYLADSLGKEKTNKISLFTKTEDFNKKPVKTSIDLKNYPNPFDNHTFIDFTVPPNYYNENVKLNIYDLEGNLIKELVNKNLPSANYSYKWDGTNLNSDIVSSGVYVYTIRIGDMQESGKMMFERK